MEIYDYTLQELKNMAKERGIKNISKLKKDELIDLINNNNIEKRPNKDTNETNEAGYKLTSENDEITEGILEVLPDGYGFLRGENYLPTPKDIYVSPIQIRRFKLNTGDKIKGISRVPKEGEKFPALIFVGEVNGESPEKSFQRKTFDDLTPIHPNERLRLETVSTELAMRLID